MIKVSLLTNARKISAPSMNQETPHVFFSSALLCLDVKCLLSLLHHQLLLVKGKYTSAQDFSEMCFYELWVQAIACASIHACLLCSKLVCIVCLYYVCILCIVCMYYVCVCVSVSVCVHTCTETLLGSSCSQNSVGGGRGVFAREAAACNSSCP